MNGPILLFGAGGQLGSEILELGHRQGIPVIGLKRSEADILDGDSVAAAIARTGPGLMVNAAAYTAVDKAEQDVEAAFAVNRDGPRVVAEESERAGVPLIHFSTDYVFDGAYVEDDAVAPVGVYGRSKAEGEAAVRAATARHLIIRTSWVYGEYGSNFLKTMLRLAREREELRVVADQRGCPTATADLARAVFAARRRISAGAEPWGTYHFAGAGATSWFDFAREIIEAATAHLARRPQMTPISTADYPTAARRPANSELDSSRFSRTFGYSSMPWQVRTRQVVSNLLQT